MGICEVVYVRVNKHAGIVLFDVQQAALISREALGFDDMPGLFNNFSQRPFPSAFFFAAGLFFPLSFTFLCMSSQKHGGAFFRSNCRCCDLLQKISLIIQAEMNRFSRPFLSSLNSNLFSSESIVSPKPDTF
ncbi:MULTISPECIES: hypothetical protein [Kosakonia]|uniref:hypothetical protein n=1 Tax=Kosakonia TaxID=1330547 RepID=UPI00201E7063|nr:MULTISPECIES: hypothetical protein [Kosakonia]MCL6744717.1 hypothetical protein [Kosakonia sp. R1.Fl]MDZ7324613.1 hypothetical protein [Kosakonia sacchari]